jgi:hypothetical protein
MARREHYGSGLPEPAEDKKFFKKKIIGEEPKAERSHEWKLWITMDIPGFPGKQAQLYRLYTYAGQNEDGSFYPGGGAGDECYGVYEDRNKKVYSDVFNDHVEAVADLAKKM